MTILPVHQEILDYVKRHHLEKKFLKQKVLFEHNPFYPSLETELMEPRSLRIWSFRVDRKYRAIFIFRDAQTVEILDVNNHYR